MDGMTAQHALEMNPAIAKRAMTVWQDAYPAKPKALHFINMPSFMESIFNMVQSFQKQKMKERTIVHPRVCPFVTAYCSTTRSDPEIAFQILMTAYLLFLQPSLSYLPLCAGIPGHASRGPWDRHSACWVWGHQWYCTGAHRWKGQQFLRHGCSVEPSCSQVALAFSSAALLFRKWNK